MWSSRLSRISVPVILSLVVILPVACKKRGGDGQPPTQTDTTATTPPPPPPGLQVCTSGNKSKNKPIICVDASGYPDPLSKTSWDVEKGKDGKPTNNPVKVTWYAQDDLAELSVVFADSSCVEPKDVDCKKLGECTAKIKQIKWDELQKEKKKEEKSLACKYSVTITTPTTKADPDGELIVNPCCW